MNADFSQRTVQLPLTGEDKAVHLVPGGPSDSSGSSRSSLRSGPGDRGRRVLPSMNGQGFFDAEADLARHRIRRSRELADGFELLVFIDLRHGIKPLGQPDR
jgi:hypothetical protein